MIGLCKFLRRSKIIVAGGNVLSTHFMSFTFYRRINPFAECVEVNWKFSTLQSEPTGVGQWPVKH